MTASRRASFLAEADTLRIIGRTGSLFTEDLEAARAELSRICVSSRFLVVGGAGSIGQAVVREIFMRNPRALHVVDLSENNIVELVRDIRSSLGYGGGDFRLLPLDSSSTEFEAFVRTQEPYSHILNLSALKHVRSEKDPYTLMRMVMVNIFNADRLAALAASMRSLKFFCVSTDKAANPVNMMGASKRIMEMFVEKRADHVMVSMARFANVAFSDGSLLHGFEQRLKKGQPLAAPRDVRRYFVTAKEGGELCLMSCLLGGNREIFFPKLEEELHLMTFDQIAIRLLERHGFGAVLCGSEEEARVRWRELTAEGKWPCYFFDSDTTGEKDKEEFTTGQESVELDRFKNIGVITHAITSDSGALEDFRARIEQFRMSGMWTKEQLVGLFRTVVPEFEHLETNKYLDQRM